jgi:hypothetical protein
MKYDEEQVKNLGHEMFELWWECKTRVERIEELIKQINGSGSTR